MDVDEAGNVIDQLDDLLHHIHRPDVGRRLTAPLVRKLFGQLHEAVDHHDERRPPPDDDQEFLDGL